MKALENFDAILVGASFAGLAAAGQLRGAGRVLLVDRQPLGAGETSACGTPLAVLERLDALDALEQIHPTVAINAAGRRIRFRPAYPFATFDYRTLCDILVSRLGDVEVVTAASGGLDADGTLRVGDRRVRSRVLIDASGWRAVLAREHGAPPPDAADRSVGIELRHDHGGCDLEFWVRPVELPRASSGRSPRVGTSARASLPTTGPATSCGQRSSSWPTSRLSHLGPCTVVSSPPVCATRWRGRCSSSAMPPGSASHSRLKGSGRHWCGARRQVAKRRGWLAERSVSTPGWRRTGPRCWLTTGAIARWNISRRRCCGSLLPWSRPPYGWSPGVRSPTPQRCYWEVADPDRLEVAPGLSGRTRVRPEQCGIGKAAAPPPCSRADPHGLARPKRDG